MTVNKFTPVSVIIPCYCCNTTIERAVDSVAKQTQLPYELILVDDGSPDQEQTLQALERLKEKYIDCFDVKIITLKVNQGASTARNAGWKVATQPYIAFLDADDAWHPKKIELQYQYMERNPEVVLSGHGFRLLKDSNAIANWDLGTCVEKRISKIAMLTSNRFITPSVMLKRDISFRFFEGKRHMEDHLLWSQLVCSGEPVIKLSIALAAIYKFSYGIKGLSSQTHEMRAEEIKNYKTLYLENHIGFIECKLLLFYSFLKYCKRILIVSYVTLRRLLHKDRV